jgi:hypothetical protein
LVGPLLSLLTSGARPSLIEEHLRRELIEHFGAALPADVAAAAARIARWLDRGWRSVGKLQVVQVALLNEGTEVWRPVQARSLGGSQFRIVEPCA